MNFSLSHRVRPRYGASRYTAVITGGFVAFINWIWVLLGLLMADCINTTIAWITAVWGVVEVPLASVIGGACLENGLSTRPDRPLQDYRSKR